MDIRADQIMMGAVVLLGAGAFYLLARPRSRPAPIPPAREPEIPILATPLPFPQNLVRTPRRAALRAGSAYRGRIEMAPSAGIADVAAALRAASFEPIEISLSSREVEDWLPQLREGATAGSRFFLARWRGATNGAAPVDGRVSAIVPTVTVGSAIGASPYWLLFALPLVPP